MRKGCQGSAKRFVHALCCHLPKSAPLENLLRLLFIVFLSAAAASGQSQSRPPEQLPSQQPPEQKVQSPRDTAHRASTPKPTSATGRVYTENDLSVLPRDTISVVGREIPAATPSASAKNLAPISGRYDDAKSGKNDEEHWRKRFLEIQNQMAAVDLRIKQVSDDIATFESDARNGSVAEVNFPLPELLEEKQELQKQIEHLQEEGREAGANPGWFR